MKLKLRDLLIVGCGGLAREMAHLIGQLHRDTAAWRFAGFVAPEGGQSGTVLAPGVVAMTDKELSELPNGADVILGLGRPARRAAAISVFKNNKNLAFPNLVHPSASLDSATLHGEGNVFTAGTIFSCDIKIGRWNHFNWNVSVGHDARIGDCNVFNPSACVSGGVVIGSRCLVGAGAIILEGLSLCDDLTIGAGAVVTRDITQPGTTWIGVPARPLE
jgi:sugar O-acyltransferase (sialic acid O-acetyltransferase NeuD family)